MFYKKARKSASMLSSLMSQTNDTMVCFTFRQPIDPNEPQEIIDAKLRDATVVEASRSFARYFGFEQREDVIGVHLMTLFNNEVPEWFIDYGQEVEDQNFENIEREIEIPVGQSTLPVRIYMQNIFDNNLLCSQWLTIRDISKEKANSRAIKDNQQIQSLALEAVGLRTFSLKFNQEDNANPHGEMTVADTPMSGWWDDVHEEDQPILEQAFEQFYFGQTERLHTLFRTAAKDRHEVWMESWAVATERDKNNQPKGIVGVVMDRTQSKLLEAKLIASQRLESLGVLAGGIAHDFNNLLMTVIGAIDIAQYKHPTLKEELSVIDEAARQATQLCNQLLTYAGRGSAELSSVELGQTINSMQDLLAMSVDSDAKLNISVRDDCWVNGEASQIRQIAMNLAINASDALDGKPGTISINVGKETYREAWRAEYHLGATLKKGDYVLLTVADNGKGMDQEQLSKLFDPFYTTKFTGRGLGLSVVMGAVRNHGGAIKVESQLNIGTTINILLPLSEPSTMTTNVEEQPATLPLSGRVLVVDDEQAVLEMAKKLLETIGIDCVLSPGGYEALDIIKQTDQNIDAVILDVTMPQIDGVETASRILAENPEANIIMCSGYSNVVMPPKLADAVDFLQKPFRLEELRGKLEPILVQN